MEILSLNGEKLNENYNELIQKQNESLNQKKDSINVELDNIVKIEQKQLELEKLRDFLKEHEIEKEGLLEALDVAIKRFNNTKIPDPQYGKFLKAIEEELKDLKEKLRSQIHETIHDLEVVEKYKNITQEEFDFEWAIGELDKTSIFTEEEKLSIIQYFAYINVSDPARIKKEIGKIEVPKEKETKEETKKIVPEENKKEEIKEPVNEEKEEIKEEKKEIKKAIKLEDLKEKLSSRKANMEWILQKRAKTNFDEFEEALLYIEDADLTEEKKQLLNNFKNSAQAIKNRFEATSDYYLRLPDKVNKNNYQQVVSLLESIDENTKEFKEQFSEFYKEYKEFNSVFGNIIEKPEDKKEATSESQKTSTEAPAEEKPVEKPSAEAMAEEKPAEEPRQQVQSISENQELVTESQLLPETKTLNISDEYKDIYEKGQEILNKYQNVTDLPSNMGGYVLAIEQTLSAIEQDPSEANLDSLKALLAGFNKLANAEKTENSELEEFVGPTNILLFLNGGIGSETSLFDETLSKIDSGSRERVVSKIFEDFDYLLTVAPWTTKISRMGKSKVDHLKLNGGQCYGKDESDEARNYKCGGNRVCVYAMPVSQENKEKLIEYYGLPDLDSVLLIGGATKSHDKIEEFLAKPFSTNHSEVLKLIESFEDSEIDVKELARIIEDRNPYYEYKKAKSLEEESQRGEGRK